VHVGAGSWSFIGIQAIAWELEKPAPCNPRGYLLTAPGGCNRFIAMYYQYLEILV